MNTWHSGLVNVEERISLLLRTDLILSLVFFRKFVVLSLGNFLFGILLAGILVVYPCEWNTFLSATDGFTTLLGSVEERVAVGFKLAVITEDSHDKGISRNDYHSFVEQTRVRLLTRIQKYTAVGLGFFKSCSQNLCLSLYARFLNNFFICHLFVII